ncbi:MAG: hypothetical protein H6642_16365 [Caldilineaceae bacterium]|nr:hypothetical protein [Caldilineaceae bacterium]MCB9139918.1 hypothetical protein [Caldilineaceae bacterium]
MDDSIDWRGWQSRRADQKNPDLLKFSVFVSPPVIIPARGDSLYSSHPIAGFFYIAVMFIHFTRGQKNVNRRKLNRAWETVRSMPMPAIASDRLVDLHNDLTYYDTSIARQVREYLRGNPVNMSKLRVDVELEETLRSFKTENSAEVECRREMLRYKRRIDDVVRELHKLIATMPQT